MWHSRSAGSLGYRLPSTTTAALYRRSDSGAPPQCVAGHMEQHAAANTPAPQPSAECSHPAAVGASPAPSKGRVPGAGSLQAIPQAAAEALAERERLVSELRETNQVTSAHRVPCTAAPCACQPASQPAGCLPLPASACSGQCSELPSKGNVSGSCNPSSSSAHAHNYSLVTSTSCCHGPHTPTDFGDKGPQAGAAGAAQGRQDCGAVRPAGRRRAGLNIRGVGG